MSDRVLISISDGVADVVFNRADKRNALDNAMFSAIAEAGEHLKSESGRAGRRAVRRRSVVLRRARLLVVPGDGGRRTNAQSMATPTTHPTATPAR